MMAGYEACYHVGWPCDLKTFPGLCIVPLERHAVPFCGAWFTSCMMCTSIYSVGNWGRGRHLYILPAFDGLNSVTRGHPGWTQRDCLQYLDLSVGSNNLFTVRQVIAKTVASDQPLSVHGFCGSAQVRLMILCPETRPLWLILRVHGVHTKLIDLLIRIYICM
jgi:hypothetical protein